MTTVMFMSGILQPISSHAAVGNSSCPSTLKPGDMVKVTGKPAIYVISSDSRLLYFPDGNVFKSWRPTYGGYTRINQACLDSIPIPTAFPSGVNFRPGSYVVKRPSSDQLYVVEPNNTLAKISPQIANALYGTGHATITISDVVWPNYVNRGPDVTATRPHPGMLIRTGGKIYYVESNNTFDEVTSEGFIANQFQTRFIHDQPSSVLSGATMGQTIRTELVSASDMTQGAKSNTVSQAPSGGGGGGGSSSSGSSSSGGSSSSSGSSGGSSVSSGSSSSGPTSGASSGTGTPESSPSVGSTVPINPTSPVTTVTVPATGNTYYVAPNGNDSNTGTAASPWATPGYASRQLKPGDTLIIKGGTYNLTQYDSDIIIPNSGTATNYVVIKGEDGNRPILKGGNNLITAIDLSKKDYVKIANLEITNNGNFRDAIQAYGPSNHIVLENLYIHHIDEFGINMSDPNDMKIVNSIISYTGFGSIGGSTGSSGGWRNILITGTTMSYNGHYYKGGPGPSPYSRPDGFGIEPSAGPIEIAYSIAEHNRGDGIDSKADNTNIHDTVIRNNSSDGLKLWGTNSKAVNVLIYGHGDGAPTSWASIVIHDSSGSPNFTLDHVTVDEPQTNCYIMHVQYDYPDVPTNLTIKNSVFNSRGGHCPMYIARGVKTTITNTAFYFPGSDNVIEYGSKYYDSTQLGQLGTGIVYGDPKFISPAWGSVGNYAMQTGSLAATMGYQ